VIYAIGCATPEITRITSKIGCIGAALLDSNVHRFNGQVLHCHLAALFAVATAATTAFNLWPSRCTVFLWDSSTQFWSVGAEIPAKLDVFVLLDFHCALSTNGFQPNFDEFSRILQNPADRPNRFF
jgi:hypothetical protein